MSLGESADRCLESLQALKKGAKERKPFRTTTSTRDLLQNFERSIDDSLLILQNWVTQFNKGKQTNNDEIITFVGQVFRTLDQHIDAAKKVLTARLRRRSIFWIWFLRKKKSVLVLVPAI